MKKQVNRTELLPSHKPTNQRNSLKKGFTLIELIVVMAVIAILVLLAAPKFLNYTEKARAAQILSDIKVLEAKIDEYLINHEAFPDTFTDGMPGDGQLYDRTGKVESAPGGLKVVDGTFYPETNLGGNFYSDKDGNVVYEDNGAPSEGATGPGLDKEFSSNPVDEADKGLPLQGTGTEVDPYRIWYLEHLKEIEGDMTGHYVMMRDLDFDKAESYLNPTENMPKWSQISGATKGWEPIGIDIRENEYSSPKYLEFAGEINGSGFGIYNLFIYQETGESLGLFRNLGIAQIDSLGLHKVAITGNNIGALAGKMAVMINTGEFLNARVSNLIATGEITDLGYSSGYGTGGIIGHEDISINRYVTSPPDSGGALVFSNIGIEMNISISGYKNGAGGMVGTSDGNVDKTFENILTRGNINAGQSYSVGGLIGKLTDSSDINIISNSNNYMDIQGNTYTGGILGEAHLAIIENSNNYGNIASVDSAGGIAGQSNQIEFNNLQNHGDVTLPSIGYVYGAGGIAGEAYGDKTKNLLITNLYNYGDVSTESNESNSIGGLFGYLGDYEGASNWHNYGNVTGYEEVGGLIGAGFRLAMSNVSISGNVTGKIEVGGLLGEGRDLVVRNYHINSGVEIVGDKNVGGAIGITVMHPLSPAHLKNKTELHNGINNATIRSNDSASGVIAKSSSNVYLSNIINLGKVESNTIQVPDVFKIETLYTNKNNGRYYNTEAEYLTAKNSLTYLLTHELKLADNIHSIYGTENIVDVSEISSESFYDDSWDRNVWNIKDREIPTIITE